MSADVVMHQKLSWLPVSQTIKWIVELVVAWFSFMISECAEQFDCTSLMHIVAFDCVHTVA